MEKTPAQLLHTPVQFLKGGGPQRAEILAKLGLFTARDVLFFFPRDYQDLTHLQKPEELQDGALVRMRGTVYEIDFRPTSSGGSMFGMLMMCGAGFIRALWFNQPHFVGRYTVGQELLLSGRIKLRGGTWELPHPSVMTIDADVSQDPCLAPIYPLTEGLHQQAIRKLVHNVVEEYADKLEEVFPPEFLAERDLPGIADALRGIHFPHDRPTMERARFRLAYQELLLQQLALAMRKRQQRDQLRATPLLATAQIDARIRRLFPFDLTVAQQQAIRDITADLGRSYPMNRLLQGDVGSGKTAVALYAMLTAVACGQQAVLMAPTEVLARQHCGTLEKVLAESRVRWSPFTGSLTGAERKKVMADVAAGELDLLIGTQAIVESGLTFARLGLVVVDEQHKFGVAQRASLKQSTTEPHCLVMTATPIPRTMAMTVYGDLEVSTLRELPPGRPPMNTYLATEDQRDKWWEFFRKKLREGRQGYVVAPLVEDSEELETASVASLYEALANGPLEAFRLGLLHGRMTTAEKDNAMTEFRAGRTQVLVATTVVEVGVDVPNATVMTIEGGERFGLAQLHQLRGRVGRGTYPGFCCVFADPTTTDSRERLEAFVSTVDGFQLAELDFSLRGPGELFGTRQHGLPTLRVANLALDTTALEQARRDAQQLVEQDPDLQEPAHAILRRRVLGRYGNDLHLGHVGRGGGRELLVVRWEVSCQSLVAGPVLQPQRGDSASAQANGLGN